METYEAMRAFADSWFLVFMVAVFIGVVAMVFWPGASKAQRDAASIPFRNEDAPASFKDGGSE